MCDVPTENTLQECVGATVITAKYTKRIEIKRNSGVFDQDKK